MPSYREYVNNKRKKERNYEYTPPANIKFKYGDLRNIEQNKADYYYTLATDIEAIKQMGQANNNTPNVPDFEEPLKQHGGVFERVNSMGSSNLEAPHYFEDGSWDPFDVTKTLSDSTVDFAKYFGTGLLSLGESAIDGLSVLANYWAQGQMSQYSPYETVSREVLLGDGEKVYEEHKQAQIAMDSSTEEFVQGDLINEREIAEEIIVEPYEDITGHDVEIGSVVSEEAGSLIESGGRLLGTSMLQSVGVPWWVTTGLTTLGSETEAALNEGYTYEEALWRGVRSASIEILVEKLSGGISFGGKTLDNIVLDKLLDRVSSSVAKTVINLGADSLGEGLEEVLSYALNDICESLENGEDVDIKAILTSDEALDSFVSGAILGGFSGGTKTGVSVAQGKDPVTGLTKNEQKVVDKAVNDAIAEKESNGEKVSAKEKAKIRQQVMSKLEKGYISIDDIESVLGGDTYKEYQALVESEDAIQKEFDELGKKTNPEGGTIAEQNQFAEDQKRYAELKQQLEDIKKNSKRNELKDRLSNEVFALVKDSRLNESYNEKARRSQAYEADVSKYDEKQRAIIQKAIDSGILNNTNRTHEFVDLIAKISADKGIDFAFADNAKLKETGFVLEGKQVNGVKTGDGNVILNIESHKALESVVGHEVAHVLEGTEMYDTLANSIIEYARAKGEYDARLKAITKLYEGVYEGDDFDGDVKKELVADLVGDYLFTDTDFINTLCTEQPKLFKKIFDEIKYLCKVATGSKEARKLEKVKKDFERVWRESKVNKNTTNDGDVKYSVSEQETQEINAKLNEVGFDYDAKSETVSYSLSSLEDAFHYKTDEHGLLLTENDYLKARNEYVDALAKSIAVEKGKPTREEYKKADRYLDSLFLVHDMIAADKDRLDYEAAVNRSAWVGNVEYGGSIDFSTLCAKRRLFTGTFDAIQNALPDTVLTDKDFLNIRNLLLEHGEESPCSMCYVEGSRAKHGVYVDKFLKDYLKTNPKWKPQIADFTSTTRLEQTRIQHPEAYAEYVRAMNKLSQRKPKEASVRTDYKGEILVAFSDGSSVEIKNKNGGIRFNSFSDFEVIHALDCMQVLTDMARVGLNGQAYTKVKEFAECFGNTGMKINLSLVAKGVDANGRLIMDETNGMNYAEAMDIRNRYSDNVGTVIVVFNDEQLRAALADDTIDFVLPFHRSQWRKSQYALMGLPEVTRDYTNIQNDRYKNPKTGRPKKAPTGNIMPNEYWDFSKSGRENAQRYLDYINENSYIPKFDFLLNKVDGKWVLPDDAIGDGYFKLLIDFKMYNNEGIGSPQKPVLPEFNMDYIQNMLNNYVGGHQAFPVAHDVVDKFVEGKKSGKFSLSEEGEHPIRSHNGTYGEDIRLVNDDMFPIKAEMQHTVEDAPVRGDIAPVTEDIGMSEDDERAYFESLTDADAPPEFDAPIYDMGDTSRINDVTLKSIGQRLRETLSLNAKETKAIQEVVQKYSTAGLPDKATIFDEIKEKFGEKEWKNRVEEVAEAKRTLRGFKINVSDTIKGDIPDYRDWRKRHQGKLIFSKDGLAVDDIYDSMSYAYPGFFPEDIINPTDQLLKMAEVMDEDIYIRGSQEVDSDFLQEATDIIYDEISKYKDAEQSNAIREEQSHFYRGIAEEETAGRSTVKTVEERLAEKIKNSRAELLMNQQLREDSIADFEKEITRLQAEYNAKRDKNTKVANDILRRIERLQRVKNNVDADYSKRISDIEARIEKMESPEYKRANQRKFKQEVYKSFMEKLVGDTSTWRDKSMGIFYEVNTLRRNLRDVVRGADGKRDIRKADAIYDELQGRYNHNEAELNRESNRIKDEFAKLKINNAESTYIQMLGEFRHNPQTTLTEDVVKAYYNKHKSRIDTAKVDKAIDMARQTYDSLLLRVNEVLQEQGMKEIPYRKGYFPHFNEDKQSLLGKLFNWKTKNDDIPTDIAGLTEMFEPNRSWQSFNKQRKGDTTEYNFLKGLDTYVQGSLDWIYHIEDIQKRRAFENYIRYIHSEQGVKDKIDAIRNNDEYDADEMQAQIDLVYKEAKNPLGNFVTDFHTQTNTLAGKKSSMDRGMEQKTNRKIYSVMTNVSNRVTANSVVGSVSSALTNFIPITQSWVQVNPGWSLLGMKKTIQSMVRDDGTIDKSDFLTNRLRKADNLYRTNWDKASNVLGIMMDGIDNFTSQTIWRSKYMQNLHSGMSEAEAIKNADQFAENVMAGRSRGNNPTLFDSKNPITKVFTAFQLEVNNQYGYMFKDAPQDMADVKYGKAKLVAGFTTAFIGAYAYNALFSTLTGRDAAFDPIGIIEDLLRDLGLFGDDDEEEEEIAPVDVAMNFTENVLEDVPFVGGLLGGGRIPISSAMPYGGLTEMIEGTIQDVSDENKESLTKEWLKPLWYLALPMGGGQLKKTFEGLSMFDDDLPVSGSYTDNGDLRFPVEDTPLNKLQAAIFGQWSSKNARDYFDNNRQPLKEQQIEEFVDLDLPIAEYWEIREGLKECDDLEEKFDYIADLDLPVNKKNILINNIVDRDEEVDLENYDDFDSYDEFDFATKYPDKHEFLEENDISYEEYEDNKQEYDFMYKYPEKYEFFNSVGLSVEDYYDLDEDGRNAYTWAYNNPEKYVVSQAVTDDVIEYKRYTKALSNIKADYDRNGNPISGSKKEKVIDYINSLDIEYGQAIILYQMQYKSDDTYKEDIIDYLNNRDDISREEMITILEELGAEVDSRGQISW
jgi:hypothetical protein